MEQNAAWENIEAKSNAKEGQVKEKFVSSSYMKQLELQKEHRLMVDQEETVNQQRVANADT